MKLKKIQTDHFDSMTKAELMDVVQDSRKQLDSIAFSSTEHGARKRAELEAYIKYAAKRLETL